MFSDEIWIQKWYSLKMQACSKMTPKNLSSRQQMRNICLEFSASLVKRLEVFILTSNKVSNRVGQSLQDHEKERVKETDRQKIKTKGRNKAPIFYIKHTTNSGHVPPKQAHILLSILRQLIPVVFWTIRNSCLDCPYCLPDSTFKFWNVHNSTHIDKDQIICQTSRNCSVLFKLTMWQVLYLPDLYHITFH